MKNNIKIITTTKKEHIITCNICKAEIKGSSDHHANQNYQAHLWFKHREEKHE